MDELAEDFMKGNYMSLVGMTPTDAGQSSFSLCKMKTNDGQSVVRVAKSPASTSERPVMAYWVPQGSSCDIPHKPGDNEPKVVFTPDFSGCGLYVDQHVASYRVYHVQGGSNYCSVEYSNKDHGVGFAGGMEASDYGSSAEQVAGFAYLRYMEDRWWIYYQRQTGIGLGCSSDGVLQAVGSLRVSGGGRIPIARLPQENPRMVQAAAGIGEHDLGVSRLEGTTWVNRPAAP
jgi:hypothetical protein